MWSGRTDDGIVARPVGIHESPEEILVGAYYYSYVAVGYVDCLESGISGGAFYLYVVLENKGGDRSICFTPL